MKDSELLNTNKVKKETDYIAHPDPNINGTDHQSVKDHLFEVSELAGMFASKIGQKQVGEILGLLHDFGKYSQSFQAYVKSATGIINPDEDDFVDAKGLKGKIDHSTAGAQWLYQHLAAQARSVYKDQSCMEFKLALAVIQILPLCIASHHSGLIDNLASDKGQGFSARLQKLEINSYFQECCKSAEKEVLSQAKGLVTQELIVSIVDQLKLICSNVSETEQAFYLGMYCKFMFSCLIDADRINSADFETPENRSSRNCKPEWGIAVQRVENFVAGLKNRNKIDEIRRDISNHCLNRAPEAQGIYSLSVPTGGGKTYSSLRYAVHHAKQHKLDRILYVIPYTSIIDQNAAAIREVLELEGDVIPWVLEHHSNLEPEQQTWHSKLVSENWDAPIVLTTMVQFLETLFSGGTRGARRLHQLAKSVIVFDEIQTLPINCVHIFNNAINFLAANCNTTAVMCTATQPLLNKLENPEKGQLNLLAENELMPNITELFSYLKRVEVVDATKVGGWSVEELSTLAFDELEAKASCLIIVNTKRWAQSLYQQIESAYPSVVNQLFHLSTAQCPAHRQSLLTNIRQRLKEGLPVLCISTQLIEAGVDVDFTSVIRFKAGLDSIAQAAGRCNRNGLFSGNRQVYLINPDNEKIDLLTDIKVGQEKTDRILTEYKNQDLLDPEIMAQYFNYYFYQRSNDMSYQLKAKHFGRDTSLLSLLSSNELAVQQSPLMLRHAFMSAGKAFKAIDAPTQSLIVQYDEGELLLADLCSLDKAFNAAGYYQALKKLQKYSVNLFPNTWEKLSKQQAIIEISAGEGIFYLDKSYYSEEFGVSEERVTSRSSELLAV